MNSWLTKHGPRSVTACLVCLALVLILAALPALWLAGVQHGAAGWQAVVVAAAVCGLAGSLALATAAIFRRPAVVMYALGLGMLFRIGLPLGVGTALDATGGPLAQAGVFGWIVVFFLLTLAVETLLSLSLFAAAGAPHSTR